MSFYNDAQTLLPFARSNPIAASFKVSKSLLIDDIFFASNVAKAPRGGMLAAASGTISGMITHPLLTGAIAGIIGTIVPGLPVVTVALAASAIALYPAGWTVDTVTRGYRKFTAEATRLRRLEMGGHYKDTETAMALRQFAIQQMSSAQIQSRRYLGQEALMFHR